MSKDPSKGQIRSDVMNTEQIRATKGSNVTPKPKNTIGTSAIPSIPSTKKK